MAWGYSQSNGLFSGYEPGVYQEVVRGSIDGSGSGSAQAATKRPTNPGYTRYSGGGNNSNQFSQSIQRLRFTEDAPNLPDLPTLAMPKIDKRKIRALTQQIAAPSLRRLNEQVQGAMNIHSDNPNVRRMTLREALMGYGSGLESAMAGAGGQARQEHQQELNMLAQEAQQNWQARTQALMSQYQNAFQKYLASAERETQQITSKSDDSGGGEWYRTQFGSLRRVGPGGERYGGTY